jgi:Fe-S cluster assembly iron-binding protein IscA
VAQRIGGYVTIDVTDEAVEVLRRSLELGNVDATRGGVRLRGARGLGGGMDIQVELADAPLEEERVIEREGVRIFVDPEVTKAIPDAVVAVEPQHEVVVVRPADRG